MEFSYQQNRSALTRGWEVPGVPAYPQVTQPAQAGLLIETGTAAIRGKSQQSPTQGRNCKSLNLLISLAGRRCKMNSVAPRILRKPAM